MHRAFADKIRIFLTNQQITWAILAISLAGRVMQLIFFYNIRFDGSYQYIATRNFTGGHGFSLSTAAMNDLSVPVYEYLVNWPPGYSLLLAPFYLLFNQNYILAGLTLDILAAGALIIYCRKLLKLLATPILLVNIFTLLTSFFIYYFYYIASSDAVTICLYVAALYYCLSICGNQEKTSVKTILLFLLLLICGLTKYLFLPLVFILPLFLLVKGIADDDARIRSAGVICFTVLVLTLGGLLAWQKYNSGTAAYISEPERGFFPEHLLSAYPAIPASLLKPDTVGLVVNQPSGTGSTLYQVYQVLHLVILIAVIIGVCRLYLRQGLKKISLPTSFIYISATILFTITLLLGVLSILVPKETINPGWIWTYIEEPRYYGLVNVLLHLSIFILYKHRLLLKQYWSPALFYLLIAVMVPDMIRGMVFDGHRVLNAGKEQYSWQYELSIQQFADSLIREHQSRNPGSAMVVTGPSHYMNNRVSLYNGIPVLKEFQAVNAPSSVRTSKPVTLLVIIPENELPNFTSFTATGPEAGRFKGYRFYMHDVKPD